MKISTGDASRDAGVPRNTAGNTVGNTPGNTPGNAAIPGGSKAGSDTGDPGSGDPGKGWYSRGYLPHFDQPGLIQAITFRLHDSVPAQVIERWKTELSWRENLPGDAPAVVTLRQRIVKYEDAGHGACWLRQPAIAALVEDAMLYFDGARYRLIAWCIMVNHVHTLIETFAGHPLDKVMHSWKSFTAQQANKLLGRQGEFWAREYFDRFIRNEQHLVQAITYIEQNPVKAGLVDSPEAWLYSSASWDRRRTASKDAGVPWMLSQDAGVPGDP
jgi:REP element-mobilizing transposase RayT